MLIVRFEYLSTDHTANWQSRLDGSQPSHGLHSWAKMLQKLEDKTTRIGGFNLN